MQSVNYEEILMFFHPLAPEASVVNYQKREQELPIILSICKTVFYC